MHNELTIKIIYMFIKGCRPQPQGNWLMWITAEVHHLNTFMNVMLQVPVDICPLLPNPAWDL